MTKIRNIFAFPFFIVAKFLLIPTMFFFVINSLIKHGLVETNERMDDLITQIKDRKFK